MRTPLAAVGVVLALLSAAPPAAAREPDPGRSRAGTPVAVLLELDTEAAAPAYRRAAAEARRSLRSPEAVRREAARAGAEQRGRAVRAVDRLAAAVRAEEPAAGTLYRTQTLLTGLAVRTPPGALRALGRLPGVRAVHPIALKERSNAHAVPLTGGPAVWSAPAGTTGEGVRIGIVDSGIDYTHADFGGPGTEAAFATVDGAAPAPAALFPNAKVIGGRDLVGDAYDPDPSSPGYQPQARPDANPIDCAANGHGSHVAGTAAGYGVTADGRTYRGPYREGLDPAAFRVGPGTAPGAQLYAIRVFGCEGSTDRLGEALDLAADPDGDGDPSDRLDVVNLSLGSRFGGTRDADALAADRLAGLGTLVVASAGNDGDLYAVGGSPGTAPTALAVAASVDPHGDADGIRVLAPPALAGVVPAHWSAEYHAWSQREVRGELALPAGQADGCAAFDPADAALITGRIAVLRWATRDADRACGSAARADHAADAGAIGTLFAADGDNLGEVAGNDRIPAAVLARAEGERLIGALKSGPVTVGLAAPGNPLHGAVSQDQPQRADTLASFTSRGIGVPGTVKPDLAAPGETIWSAKAGSGSGGMREDGTSMAAPHAAGLAALVRAAHPDWTVAEVKAALMNTAGDLWLGDGRTGPLQAPERAGAGQVRADLAVRTPAVAYAAGEGAVEGAVGVSFGPVEITGPVAHAALAREVEVRNLSGAPLAYTTAYRAATEVPGAAFEITPARVQVPAGGTARVRITLRARGRLERAPDPTLDLQQAGRARTYRAELSGRLLLTPVPGGAPQLRVPVFAAPRPATDLTAVPRARTAAGGTLLALRGTAAPTPDGAGLVSAFVLGGEAPAWPGCPAEGPCATEPGDRSANLRAAGAAGDLPTGSAPEQGRIHLAAVLRAPAATPAGLTGVRASLDTDGDGRTDAVVAADRLRGSDVLVARTFAAATGRELDVQPLNARWGDTDTGLLDGDAVVLPVRLAALPRPAGATTVIRYAVWTGPESPGAMPDPAGALDAIGLDGERPVLPLDVAHPAPDVRTGGDGGAAIAAQERPGGMLEVRTGGSPQRLLLIHHLNPVGRRAQILALP
ncbi:S8 family serine peptidase [Kitasatospora camelliae]|uniref:S8 family serine peptidase n=1 Tax=Kitasatospora camelliae TaxID=3156397 RepID=A0AAU8K2I3_9ACTN